MTKSHLHKIALGTGKQSIFKQLLSPENLSVPSFLLELYKRRQKGFKLDLNQINAAVAKAEFSSQPACSIQVIGTNGKGTTATCIANLLSDQGFKVGLFTSPHLLSFRERIQTNTHWPDYAEIKLHFDALKAKVDIDLSFFEWTALIAKSIFRQAEVDVEVWEAGLGGRLDATTAFDHDMIALTSIGRDHENVLGSDLISICSEKVAAAKKGQVFFVAAKLNSNEQDDQRLKKWICENAKTEPTFLDKAEEPTEICIANENKRLAQKVADTVLQKWSFDDTQTKSRSKRRFELLGRNMWLTPNHECMQVHPGIDSIHIDVCHNLAALQANMQRIPSNTRSRSILLYSCLHDKWNDDLRKELEGYSMPTAVFASGPEERRLSHRSENLPFYPDLRSLLDSAWLQKSMAGGKKKLLVWGSFFGVEALLKQGLTSYEGETIT